MWASAARVSITNASLVFPGQGPASCQRRNPTGERCGAALCFLSLSCLSFFLCPSSLPSRCSFCVCVLAPRAAGTRRPPGTATVGRPPGDGSDTLPRARVGGVAKSKDSTVCSGRSARALPRRPRRILNDVVERL